MAIWWPSKKVLKFSKIPPGSLSGLETSPTKYLEYWPLILPAASFQSSRAEAEGRVLAGWSPGEDYGLPLSSSNIQGRPCGVPHGGGGVSTQMDDGQEQLTLAAVHKLAALPAVSVQSVRLVGESPSVYPSGLVMVGAVTQTGPPLAVEPPALFLPEPYTKVTVARDPVYATRYSTRAHKEAIIPPRWGSSSRAHVDMSCRITS
ncbi:uncharacterized protein LOC121374277 [Gigantopelta aegis]|uniref:uncharacterized protein LOC121374277 n=1 Tax=Gigantopelta aegis TaxID=1735272 RepID=UPI001B88E232|nr:uncharacterized protein LOC121374277 [Gigantopelta aegis]